jgi:hypothetical protein
VHAIPMRGAWTRRRRGPYRLNRPRTVFIVVCDAHQLVFSGERKSVMEHSGRGEQMHVIHGIRIQTTVHFPPDFLFTGCSQGFRRNQIAFDRDPVPYFR